MTGESPPKKPAEEIKPMKSLRTLVIQDSAGKAASAKSQCADQAGSDLKVCLRNKRTTALLLALTARSRQILILCDFTLSSLSLSLLKIGKF